jgi:transcriptional regulator with XRE-family HTH domain
MGLFNRKNEGSKWDAWIGKKIREAREQKHWTQSQLAEKLNKSQTNISDYERGRLEIGVIELGYIALALEKPITFFIPPKFNGATPNDLTDRQKEIIHYLNQASEEAELVILEQAKMHARASQQIAEQRLQEEHEIAREEHKGIDFKNPEEVRRANARTLQRIEESPTRKRKK